MSEPSPSASPLSQAVGRAVRFSYAQSMLGAIYAASTGGMFIIGYALQLGAGDPQIGLMSTIPMLCVVAQLGAACVIERGVSRRKMTIAASLVNVGSWALIILIPYVAAGQTTGVKVWSLISIMTLVTLFAHVAGNARGSWVGDLIPAGFRGTFFGRMMMYGSIVGTFFALVEGGFLDYVKGRGIGAFSWLFGFGMLFGLASTLLFVPQPDTPLEADPQRPSLAARIRQTFRNGPLMLVMLYHGLWALQGIAGPFYAAYLLRDMHMPFLGLGLLNTAVTIAMLVFSPFWGKVVDRYGCRPVLVACTALFAPLPLVWLWMGSLTLIYCVIPFTNVLAGFAISGVSVALNTLLYNVTPSAGRSVQFAVYSIIVTLVSAPMPALGGLLPDWLRRLGLSSADLRCTFYASAAFAAMAAVAARCIREPGSTGTRLLVRNLPAHVRNPTTIGETA